MLGEKVKKYLILQSNLKNEFYDYFKNKGYFVIEFTGTDNVYSAIKNHPDIFLFSTGKKLIVEPSVYNKMLTFFSENILIKGENNVGYKYPKSIYYNVAYTGKYGLHLLEHTESMIKKKLDAKWISINQGYSKCSCCIVDSKSIITSDKGIYKKIKNMNIDLEVLLIRQGFIKLPGLDFGFIGGSSVTLKKEIVFYGNISKHPDYLKIKKFINQRGKNIKEFSFSLMDIGSGIYLEEKN